MRPSRTTVADDGGGSFPLDAKAMRSCVGIFGDTAYSDWDDLFPLQAYAVSAVESVLGAAICGKRVTDWYAVAPPDGRLELSARPIGGEALAESQFEALRIAAAGQPLDGSFDLTGDAPAVVLADAAPALGDEANAIRVEYRFAPQASPAFVLEGVAVAFRGAFDARYRGAPPVDMSEIEAALGGEAMLLGPYD